MNFLAHAFLSFDNSEILVGNMISDFVKGKKKYSYSQGIQNGITLHRQIDQFTDCHPATAKAKEFFRPRYRLYAGAFVDIVFDHFVANDAALFEHHGGLQDFTMRIYKLLDAYTDDFPEPFDFMFPHMVRQDWLYNYRTMDGIRQSFGGLVRRALYLNESAYAFDIFQQNHAALRECYKNFFPELNDFALRTYNGLTAE